MVNFVSDHLSLIPVFVSFTVNAILNILAIFFFAFMLAVLEDSSSSEDDNVR